jgi:hypothetical protein
MINTNVKAMTHTCERKNVFRGKLESWNLEFCNFCVVLLRNVEGSRKTKCESEFRRGTCTFRSKTTQELQNSRFQAANFPLNTFFSLATVKHHEKLSANRNFVVELVHFEVKRRKNYRIPGSKTLTFL